jgi:hypothetical protein
MPAPAAGSSASGPDPIVQEWPRWPYLAACGAFAFDPVAIFSGPTRAENGTSSLSVALRRILNGPQGARRGLPKHHWRLLGATEGWAEFVWGRLGQNLKRITLEGDDRRWRLNSFQGCHLVSLVNGHFAASWWLARTQAPLDGTTREIGVELSPGGCSGGRRQNRHAHPVFRWLGRKLLLSIWVDPIPPGPHTCEGVVEPPLLIQLPNQLGASTLYDGGTFPPLVATELQPRF